LRTGRAERVKGSSLVPLLVVLATVLGPLPGWTQVPASGVIAPGEVPDSEIPYQVEIEVIVADLAKDFSKDLGFIYRFTESPERADEEFRIGDSFILLPATTDGSVESPLEHGFVGADIQGNIWTVDFGTFSARLQAAVGRGEGEILARPRIMTLNRQQAQLKTGDRVPFLSRQLAGTSNNQIYTSEYVDTGVELTVTPDVILQGDEDPDNDYIQLNLVIVVDFISRELVVFDSGQQQPVISSRDATTTVIVKDNHTFGIGGLYREDVKISKRGVPYLKDIWGLGNLFQATNETRSNFELVVFITPRIDRNIEYELKALAATTTGGGE
jgi:type II secretory pathway component GspD/PulD (secretin)